MLEGLRDPEQHGVTRTHVRQLREHTSRVRLAQLEDSAPVPVGAEIDAEAEQLGTNRIRVPGIVVRAARREPEYLSCKTTDCAATGDRIDGPEEHRVVHH